MDRDIFEEKIIQLSNGLNYFIIKDTIFNDKIYLLGNELIDDETPSENIAILKVENNSDGVSIIYENNEQIQNQVMEQFSTILAASETVE